MEQRERQVVCDVVLQECEAYLSLPGTGGGEARPLSQGT
jgi:hypothetical protein